MGVFEDHLFVSQVVVSGIDDLLLVFNSGLGLGQVVVESLQLVSSVNRLFIAGFVEVLKFGDFSPVVSSLLLENVVFFLKVLESKSKILVHVSLLVALFIQASSFVVLVFKYSS